MKKYIAIIIMVVLTSSLFIGCNSNKTQEDTTSTNDVVSNSIEHYGDAVIAKPQREAPEDPYMDTGIIRTNEYKGMTKKMEVYGITFFASDNISDKFMTKVAKTYKEIFPELEGEYAEKQAEILKNNHIYKSCLPIVLETEIENISVQLINDYSVCDIIMKTDSRQTMEVCEHLLHAITDVGLHYTYPEKFSMDKDSDLYKSMNKAIKEKYFNTESYKDIKEKETNRRILVQEFAYWLITSEWDIQEQYGPHEEEWTLLTPSKVEEKLPSGDKLYKEVIEKVMACPTEDTLANLGK